MRRELLDTIRCPTCVNGSLVVEQGHEQEIRYHDRLVSEIEHGVAACQACGSQYPIQGYVLSFAALLAPAVRADGAYWGEFYTRLYEYGIRGFLDTHAAPAPFLGMGIPQTLPFDGEEWGGIHVQLAEHRFIRPGGRVVDVGVGSGWSSLFLARRGMDVLAFDPALELMQLAKRYAIEQGVMIEYICSDMQNFHLLPESVDAVFALHSLHHVPDLEQGVRQIHAMLKQGGCLALDDHLQEVLLLARLRDGLLQEANEHIFPPLRDPALVATPPSVHSENEGVGMGQLLPAIGRYLHTDTISYRHIAFDFTGPLFYLARQSNPEALRYASEVVDLLNRAAQRAWPELVEYVTVVAQKQATLPAPSDASYPVASAAIEERLVEQEIELDRLHSVVAAKNDHIRHLEQVVARFENGRLMRILRWLSRG